MPEVYNKILILIKYYIKVYKINYNDAITWILKKLFIPKNRMTTAFCKIKIKHPYGFYTIL